MRARAGRAGDPAFAAAGAEEPGPLAVRRVGRRWSLRNLLVVGQVAVALVLLVTALLFVRNLARAEDLDPGFDVEQVLVAQIGIVQGRFTPATGTAWLDGAVERLRGMPGVEDASYAFGAPLTLRSGMTSGARLVVNGQQPGFQAMYQDNSSVRTTSRSWASGSSRGASSGRTIAAAVRRSSP